MHRFFILLTLLAGFCCSRAFSQACDSTLQQNDSILYIHKAELLAKETNKKRSELLIETAKSFIGTPYIGKTLEGNQGESLVINLHGLDCSTFIESSLAITLTMKPDHFNFSEFKEKLGKIRYRNGIIAGYGSRLHYFSDWIYDNQQKGIIKDITQEIGGIAFNKEINFMSSHPGYYARLNNNPGLVDSISQFEKAISSRKYFYIPKENVEAIEPRLEEGMIVAITSGVAGLDIAHVGFLVKVNGRIHLLHASSDAGKVIISEKPLPEYLSMNKKQTGIMVLKVEEKSR